MSISVEALNITTGYKIETHVRVYLILRGNQSMLVDTSTHYQDHAEQIFTFLKDKGVKQLDYLLLTHAHNDHVGNAGEIKKRFPDVQIVASKLTDKRMSLGAGWFKDHAEDQRAVFAACGRPDIRIEDFFTYMGEDYPSMLPQKADIIIDSDQIFDGIHCYLTPGHAMDHLCFGIEEHFFGGDMVLSYLPGMEGVWTGEWESFEHYLESAKKLRLHSDKYSKLHHFHGKELNGSLESWYREVVTAKSLSKIQKLLGLLEKEKEKEWTLLKVMATLHPKYPNHYIYMSQYISILASLEKYGFLSKRVDHQGVWHFQFRTGDIDFFHRYLN
jgi:glyoxylase-like metal-dependent hydrolase (beta-lactamase superfamily II)